MPAPTTSQPLARRGLRAAVGRAALAVAILAAAACRGPAPGAPDAGRPAPTVAPALAPPASAPATAPASAPAQPASAPGAAAAPDPRAADPDWLFPVGRSDACGFIDVRGREVLPRRFAVPACLGQAGFSRRGRFPVKLDRAFGFIDASGKVVIPARYEAAEPIDAGPAAVSRGGKWGFIDRTGREVIPVELARALPFAEGLAAVSRDGTPGSWGFVDAAGRSVIPPRFDGASSFADGLARVATRAGEAFIDHAGVEIITPAALAGLRPFAVFQGGMLAVHRPAKSWSECGYMDRSGRVPILLTNRWPHCGRFAEGLAAVLRDGGDGAAGRQRLYSFIDTAGGVVIPPRFADAGHFTGGWAAVGNGTRWGYIDRSGAHVVPPRFRVAGPFAHGLAWVYTEDGEPGWLDASGALVWPRPRPAAAGERVTMTSLLQSRDQGPPKRQLKVVRTRRELAAVWTAAWPGAAAPPLPAVDFARRTYVLVAQGERLSYEHDIRVTEAVKTPRALVVRFDEKEPEPLPQPWAFVNKPARIRAVHLVELQTPPGVPVVFEGRFVNGEVVR